MLMLALMLKLALTSDTASHTQACNVSLSYHTLHYGSIIERNNTSGQCKIHSTGDFPMDFLRLKVKQNLYTNHTLRGRDYIFHEYEILVLYNKCFPHTCLCNTHVVSHTHVLH